MNENLVKILLNSVKCDKRSLEEGEYQVKACVNISGDIKKCPDYEKTPTVKIPLKKVLALFIQYCGITRDSAIDKLKKAFEKAMEEDSKVDLDIVESAETKVKEILKELPKQKCSGRTITNVSIDNISIDLIKEDVYEKCSM